ncbi:hypothetical protein [Mycobacterium riyadhense]|uniref:hypothetical protein n=1 Tax=Mycobacterium riyadhense TaxID=486698 RepID=UPI00195E19EB|nr:hypothetical protein [Mycobacterium riyadhense]
MSENLSGIHQLHERRARRTRQAPQPRNPKLGAAASLEDERPVTVADDTVADDTVTDDTDNHGAAGAAQVQTDCGPASSPRPTDAPRAGNLGGDATPSAQPATEPGDAGEPTVEVAAASSSAAQPIKADMPKLDIDLNDPTAHLVSPTVLSIPASIVKRFERARAHAPSHTALVLDALRAHAHELPTLILSRRPGPKPGDLFPFREAPGRTAAQDTPLPVRIRPTKGELTVMKSLTDWASTSIAKQRPGTRETNRSEMVAAALDAFLPSPPERRAKQPHATDA